MKGISKIWKKVIPVHVVYLTISDPHPGTFEICPVCYWEDDNAQFKNIDYKGAANEECLREASQNFMKFGASSRQFLKYVRAPLLDEISETEKKGLNLTFKLLFR
jgi:hypothetical protein